MVPKRTISRFAAALLLATATVVQLQHAGAATSSEDACAEFDTACAEVRLELKQL